MSKVTVEVYSDIICPWCLIGSRKLARAVAALGPDAIVEIKHLPMILDPSLPPEGRDVREMIRAKTGQEPETVWAFVEGQARAAGIEVRMSELTRLYSTVPALTLIRLAAERGTQHALHRAVIDAYFLSHADISDPAVLAEIASAHGFEPAEAARLAIDKAELAQTAALSDAARARGIRSVPSYVIDGRLVPPGMDIEQALPAAFNAKPAHVSAHA